MSMMLMVEAMRAKVGSSGRKLVLIKLADNANDNGICWPSYQNIADQCEMGRTTVIAHIKKLEKDGFLTKKHRNNAKSSNQYLMHFNGKKDGGLSNLTSADSEPVKSCTSADSEPPTSADSEPRTSHSLEPVIIKKNKQKKESKVSGIDTSKALKFSSEESIRDWIDHRKAVKKPMSQRAFDLSIQNFLKVADELAFEDVQLQDGTVVHAVDQLIDYTIEAGWQSAKAEWIRNRESSNQQQTGRANHYPAPLTANDLEGAW